MVSGVSVNVVVLNPGAMCSAAADEVHNLHAITVADERCRERVAFQNRQVVLDRHAPWIDFELEEKFFDRQRLIELEGFPVERDAHGRRRTELYLTHPGAEL